MRLQALFLCSFSAMVLLLACGRGAPPLQVDEPGGDRGGEAIDPSPPPVPRAAVPQGPGGLRRLLLNVVAAPSPAAEDSFVFHAHGFNVSQSEYDEGLENHLQGRDWTEELEDEYRVRLEENLLILRWLEEAPLTLDPGFRAAARASLRRELARVALEESLEATDVPREELRAIYDSRSSMFLQPERVHVQIILVPSEEEARLLMKRLSGGESFGGIAATESRHESRSRSGELDPFPRGSYTESFEEAAFRLRPGETEIISTGAGTFIVRKIAHIPAVRIPFDQVEGQLREQIHQQRRAEKLEEVRRQVGGYGQGLRDE